MKWRGVAFEKIEHGKAQLLNDGEGIAVLSIGTVGNTVAKAVNKANESGVSVMHYNMRFLKPLDVAAIDYAASKCKTIITVEDASTIGGLFSAVCEYVASGSLTVRVINLGIPDKFVEQGSVSELHTECGYDFEGIIKTIMDAAQGRT